MNRATHRILSTLVLLGLTQVVLRAQSGITRYVRFSQGSSVSYGILEGGTVRELDGDFLLGARPTGKTFPLSDVRLEIPLDPMKVSKVLGVALNFDMKYISISPDATLKTATTRDTTEVDINPIILGVGVGYRF